ncbi:MAG: sensor histidine kinase [Paenibacillaceae bacterium]|nr:sensor histidine kinase [Paenibacillaceae bacterium]
MTRMWQNLQMKMLVILLLLCIVPLALLGAMAYYVSVSILENKLKDDFHVIGQQFDHFSSSPYFIPQILDIFNKPYVHPDQWGMQELNDQETITKMLLTFPYLNGSIAGLVFYGINGSMYGYSSFSGSSIDYSVNPYEEKWYQEAISRQGGLVISGVRTERQFFGKTIPVITIGRALLDKKFRPIAVVAIDITTEYIEKQVRTLPFHNVQVAVMDQKGQLIYASSADTSPSLQRLYGSMRQERGVQAEAEAAADGVPVLYRDPIRQTTWVGTLNESAYSKWSTLFVIDRSDLFYDSNLIRRLTLWLVFVLSLMISIVSWVFSDSWTAPIRRMIRSMRRVEQGEFSVDASSARADEIGKLERSFVQMVNRLHYLVLSIEEKERQKRVAEVYALRARINPHFLYNTLHSIRMLAQMTNASKIAHLIQSLSKLLKANMMLEKDDVKLAQEVDLLRQYVSLMELRYNHQFEVVWDIPERYLATRVPPMILQPLVENSIFHGKDRKNELHLIISAAESDDRRSLAITVLDDGRGIDEDTLRQIRLDLRNSRPNDRSIGMQNVNERLRLRFGEPYGLTIVSSPEAGTAITINIPFTTDGDETEELEDVELDGSGG